MGNEKVDWDQLHVIVVDDDKIMRDTVHAFLHELGVTQVFHAANGVEAMEFMDFSPDLPGVVICDWNMPRVTGLELLKQMRGAGSTLPFLMITGRNDVVSVTEAKAAGVTGYILKPFTLLELKNKIETVISPGAQGV